MHDKVISSMSREQVEYMMALGNLNDAKVYAESANLSLSDEEIIELLHGLDEADLGNVSGGGSIVKKNRRM